MSCTALRIGLESSEKVVRHMHLNIAKRRRYKEVSVKYDACETTINETTREDINALLEDGYKVNDDILQLPITHQSIQAKLTNWNINRYGNGI